MFFFFSFEELINIFFIIHSYVTRIDENSPTGTTLVFPEPYITRVSDDDAGKNGVFSLTLLNNNGTFEIFPNVAERKANFIIRVRDNNLLDFEEFTSLSFQVSRSLKFHEIKLFKYLPRCEFLILFYFNIFITFSAKSIDISARAWSSNESLSHCQCNGIYCRCQ